MSRNRTTKVSARDDANQKASEPSRACDADKRPPGWLPLGLVALAVVFYWISLPPLRQPWSGFVSCFFFAAAVYAPVPLNRKGYLALWLIGCVLWLALLQGIRLAFWPLYGGWIALSLYLGVYVPAFVASARSLRTRLGLPLPLACAIAWTGWELFRAYFVTGFASCLLGHSQTPWLPLLPVAAHLGMYGVSFFVMLSGATVCYFVAWYCERGCAERPARPWGEDLFSRGCAIGVLGWVVGSIVFFRLHEQEIEAQSPIKPLGKFLLVQENMPTMFDSDPELLRISWLEYTRLTQKALRSESGKDVEVVLWPESTFGGGLPLTWLDWDEKPPVPPEFNKELDAFREDYSIIRENLQFKLERLNVDRQDHPTYLVGADVVKARDGKLQRFNSALWVDADKPDVSYYSKRHLVMFGEYIPIISSFPELLSRFGMGVISSGERFEGWETASGKIIAPSICFEDVVPQLIQRQVSELSAQGKSPDVLVNITNDAWFRGSSILDHHLNNAIGCAVENRRPMLVAANSGVSAWIDGSGRVVRSLPRLEAGTIVAEPIPDGRWGLWQSIGDWPARFACFITWLPFVLWLFQNWIPGRKPEKTITP